MSAAPAAMSNAMSGGGNAMSGGNNAMSNAMSGGMGMGGMSAPPAPQPRNFAEEMGAISGSASANAQSQADISVNTADRLSDQAIESTGDIAKKLGDSTYTAAANQNIRDAGTSSAQLGQSYNQVGQVADRVAAYNDPAQARLNEMALGQLYRPDQVSSQSVSADQAQGARVADVGRMQAAQANGPSDVQGPAGYRPDQVSSQAVSGAQVGPVGDMQAARANAARMRQVADVQGASVGGLERVGGVQVGGVDPMEAARIRRTQDVTSRDIRASGAERALMDEARSNGLYGQLRDQASNDLSLGRSLSAEQSRDAIQSSRAASSARGLGLGQSAMAAELLNRDRFATARENERRTFAGNVLNQGTGLQQAANQAYMGRQESNVGRSLQAGLANQSVAANRSLQQAQLNQQAGLTTNQNAQQRVLAEAGYAQQAGLSNQDFAFRAGSQDAQLQQQAGLANQQSALATNQFNAANRQATSLQNAQFAQQAGLANQSTALQLGQTNAQFQQQAALANQSAGLQAGQLNQSANARAAEFQQQGGLQASLANQQTGLQLGLTNAQLQQQANSASYEASQQSAMANAGYAQQAGLANQQANLTAAQYNSSQNLAAQNANQSANYNANYANQNFLQGVSSQNFNQFSGQQGMLGSLYGQQAGIAQNQYTNNLGLAQANVALDPYQRALGSNIPIASQGNAANMIGQSFGNTMTYGNDVYNTNTNMQASLYNSYNNNTTALKSANIQSDASRDAAGMGLQGAAMGASAIIGAAAAACWVARAAFGTTTTRWVEYRRAMLRHASDRTIRLYCQHGQSIAAAITTPLRRLVARLTLRTLQWSWN
jgi:hypothetical protein